MNTLQKSLLAFVNIKSTTSISVSEPKKQKLTMWPEWNENDVNAEKWDIGGKAKDSKSKPTSTPVKDGSITF